MIIQCELSQHKAMFGHNVSKSNRKTKRRFNINVLKVKLNSEILNKDFQFNISAKTLKTINYFGGLDQFLQHTKRNKLSNAGIKMKKMIQKQEN